MILMLIICLIFLTIIYWYINYKRACRVLKQFNGPTPLPILGNALYFVSTEKILKNLLYLRNKYGGTYKLSFGFEPLSLVISDPKTLEFIMGTTSLLEKSREYDYFHSWLGTGLLTSSGDKWKKHRKILTPAFHFKILEEFVDVFDIYGNIMIDFLKNEVNKTSVDIYPYVTLCSLDIIYNTLMGKDIHAQTNSKSEYITNVKEICRIILGRAFNAFTANDTLYKLSNDYKKEPEVINILHSYTYSVLNARKEEIARINANTNIYEDNVSNKKTLLDILINYKNLYGTITDEEIREQLDTFMFEGHDTTSSGITFTLYCLSVHPEIQKKVVEELDVIFVGNRFTTATYKNLQEMKYLEKVIKETLRMYPPVPIIGRTMIEDFECGAAGILPKGLNITIDIFSLHRNPEIFPNPELFDPERFNNENLLKSQPYAYIPFSAGSRNCIGQKFAIMEMKAIVSKLLRRYELLPDLFEREPILIPEVILKSKSGVHMRLKERL